MATAEDWARVFETADAYEKRRDASFREPLERLLYCLEVSPEPWMVERAQKLALEALYPESGGVPPWRMVDDRDVAVPEVPAGDPDGDEGPALGVRAEGEPDRAD